MTALEALQESGARRRDVEAEHAIAVNALREALKAALGETNMSEACRVAGISRQYGYELLNR